MERNMDFELGNGSFGIMWWKGKFEYTIKTMQEEFDFPRQLNTCQNVVGFFALQEDPFVAQFFLNKCDIRLTQWVKSKPIDIPAVEILRYVTIGLEWLHYKKILHKRLDPDTILISQFPINVKIFDGGCPPAPEIPKSKCACSSDLLALGLVYNYVLSDGKHSFETRMDENAMIDINHLVLHTSAQNIHFIKITTTSKEHGIKSIEYLSEHKKCGLEKPVSTTDLWPCAFGHHDPRFQVFDKLEIACQNKRHRTLLIKYNTTTEHGKKGEPLQPSTPRIKPPVPRKPANSIKPKTVVNKPQAGTGSPAQPEKIESVRNLVTRFSNDFTDAPTSTQEVPTVSQLQSESRVKRLSGLFMNRESDKSPIHERACPLDLYNEDQELNQDALTILQIVKTRNLRIIKSTLERLAKQKDITSVWDDKQKSLLHVSVKHRDHAVVEHLISQGFSAKLSQESYSDIIHTCMWDIHETTQAKFEDKCKILQLLLKAQPKLVDSRDEYDRTPLHIACLRKFKTDKEQLELIEMLLRNNAGVNVRGWESMASLHTALKSDSPNKFELIKLLADNHAEPDSQFLESLLENGTPRLFHDVLEYLVSIGMEKLLKEFGDAKTLLHHAVQHYELLAGTLQIFKSIGFDFNSNGLDNETVLQTAYRASRSVSLLASLIFFGADPSSLTSEKNNRLHHAAWLNKFDYIKFLVSLGCDVNAKDEYGNTPLHLVFTGWTNTSHDCVSQLINHGAKVHVKNNNGTLPTELAKQCLQREKAEQRSIDLIQNADP